MNFEQILKSSTTKLRCTKFYAILIQ